MRRSKSPLKLKDHKKKHLNRPRTPDRSHHPPPSAETAAENEDFYRRQLAEEPEVPESKAMSSRADLALIDEAMQDPEFEAAMRHAEAINPQEAAVKFAPIPDFFPQITRMSQC